MRDPSGRLLLCGPSGRIGALLAATGVPGREVVGVGPGRADEGWPESVAWLRRDRPGEAADVVREEGAEAVVLFAWPQRSWWPARGAGAGTSSACLAEAAVAAAVRRVVVWSVACVAEPSAPGRGPLTEGAPIAARPAAVGRDAAEAEAEVRRVLADSAPPELVVLRTPPVVGRNATHGLAHLFRLPVLPRAVGVDPPVQLLHESDAVEVLRRACAEAPPGTYDVAADGVLAWSEFCRALGRPAVRAPAALWRAILGAARLLRLSPVPPSVIDVATRSWVVDNARLKTHIGYRPLLGSRRALAAWLRERESRDADGLPAQK